MAPPGTFVLSHEKPAKRGTWSPHAAEAWHIGPAQESYRCYKVWVIKTRGTCIMDTVQWFPHHVKMPTHSTTDLVLQAASDLAHAMANPDVNSPLHPLTDNEVHTLEKIQQVLLNRAPDKPARQPNPTPPTPTVPMLSLIHI